MPLVVATLKASLQQIFTNAANSGSNPPQQAALAKDWAKAVADYASSIAPSCTSVSSAQSTLKDKLGGFGDADMAASTMETAFSAFAKDLGKAIDDTNTKGVITATSTTPSSEVGFATLFASTYDDAGAAAEAIANKIDAWLKTGSTKLKNENTQVTTPTSWS